MTRILLALSLLLAPALARADNADAPPVLGLGVALGLNPSPHDVCQMNGDVVACTRWLPAWAMRLHVGYRLAPTWSADLIGGFGTDLDATLRSSSFGDSHDVRLFYDLALRGRCLLGERAAGWIGAEAGLMLAVDSSSDFDVVDGHRLEGTARQLAPLAGLGGGVALLRRGLFALDFELGMRVTAFGSHPPEVYRDSSGSRPIIHQATEYGARPWAWMGFGGRYGG